MASLWTLYSITFTLIFKVTRFKRYCLENGESQRKTRIVIFIHVDIHNRIFIFVSVVFRDLDLNAQDQNC